MAFVVETGLGLPSATTYVSLAEAGAYFTVDPNFGPVWDVLDQELQQAYLSWASRILDQKAVWRGATTTAAQGLRWPRIGASTRDGNVIGSTVIPRPLKDAVCELAKWLQTNDPTSGQDTSALKRVIVDTISITYQDKTFQSTFPTIINQILTGLGYVKVGGVGHAPIKKA